MKHYRIDLLGQTELRFLSPEGEVIQKRPVSADQVNDFGEQIKSAYRAPARNLESLGQRLYDWLDGANQRWLSQARGGAGAVAVDLDLDNKDLRHLPWELLCADDGFLAIKPDRPFTPVRRVGKAQQESVQAANRPLRVLFMACSPEGTDPVLDFEQEEARILDATQKQKIELVVEESGSLAGLEERLEVFDRDYFDVLHLTGHADIHNSQPRFGMEDETGGSKPATATEIGRAFKGHWPRVVFLSGCRTGQAPDEGDWPSLCEALIEAGAPAVLGWALPVNDPDATTAAGGRHRG